jgi:hypothetical protein
LEGEILKKVFLPNNTTLKQPIHSPLRRNFKITVQAKLRSKVVQREQMTQQC